MKIFFQICLLLLFSDAPQIWADNSKTIVVGSKKFTENVILGEIASLLSRNSGMQTIHKKELGGTRVLWNGLINGDIDIYPEYTGTIFKEILADKNISTIAELRRVLKSLNLEITQPLGFNNTYALGMKKETAEKYNIQSISDLKKYPQLIFGFTNEFMDRSDGWPGLRQRYQLPHKDVRGLDHDLSYRGLESGAIQVIDMYSTDAEIDYYSLSALDDDQKFFPGYEAVFVYRKDLKDKAQQFLSNINGLAGRISAKNMIQLNRRVKIDNVSESRVALKFLSQKFTLSLKSHSETVLSRLWRNTMDHLLLVLISLTAAIFAAIPLGILAVKLPRFEKIILGGTGIIQTIPSLALLVFMIPLLGIGGPPAIVALFLYSLLPIVRNTFTGLRDIPPPVRDSALALGLPPAARLKLIELPLAAPAILAGIKTSAVINVGTATLGALIGAGGYGQPILSGIRLDNMGLILQGAVPAALLALLVQWGFDLLERWIVPKGLRM